MEIFIKDPNNVLLITVLLLLAILSGCRSAQTSSSLVDTQLDELNIPKIVFAETEYDFGKVSAGAEKTCTFDFINDGGKDLVIERIYASCGCTTTTAGSMVVKPSQVKENRHTFIEI